MSYKKMDCILPENYFYALIIFINSSIRTNCKTNKKIFSFGIFFAVANFPYIENKRQKRNVKFCSIIISVYWSSSF